MVVPALRSNVFLCMDQTIIAIRQPAVSFETNPVYIYSMLLEVSTFGCVTACLEYVSAKFPAKLDVFFLFFRHLNVPHTKLSLRNLSISSGGQGFSTNGPPMAIDGIRNNFFHRWPRIDHVWPRVGLIALP